MKKIIFTLLFIAAVQLCYSQTYYWVGGTNATSFSSAANWSTTIGGVGNLPASINSTNSTGFTFIISGLDLSSDPGSQTGPLVVDFSGTLAVGQLFLENLADVTLSRTTGSSGTTTLTITGLAGPDFVINPGNKLSLTGTSGSLFIVLGSATAATVSAEISGDIILKQGTSGNNNRFTSRTTGAFVFLTGSSLTTEAAYATYPFGTTGSSTLPANYGVVFEPGSSYYHNGGLSPFGSNTISTLATFKPGSKFYFRAAQAPNMFSNKVYGDVIVQNNTSATADGSLYRIDSLRIEAGSTFITHTSGVTTIAGHILNNGTYRVPAADPDRGNRLVMIGSSPKNISGTGTFTLGRFIVSNASNVTLNKSIQVDTSTSILGILNPNGNSITGAGTTAVKTPASVNVTGDLDTFVVKNVSNLTGVEIGMSITGAGIPANTVITNVSTSSNTFTLSNATTAFTAGTALTVFNGQGVLPIKFGDVSANLQNGQTKLVWKVLTEDNISRYIVERSLNGTQFTEVGSVTPNGNKQYTWNDVNTGAGTNYYRIKAVSNDGQLLYSIVLKVGNVVRNAEMVIYSNPVTGKEVNISLTNLDKGTYTLNLFNQLGQKAFSKILNHPGGSTNQNIILPSSVRAGLYNLQLIGESNRLQLGLIVR